MKKEIHPKEYRPVVFKDISNDYSFITRSTAQTKDKIVWEDGKEYPLVKIEISDTSHPFYTGKMKLIDTAGRVDKFRNRYKKHLEKDNTETKDTETKDTETKDTETKDTETKDTETKDTETKE